MESASSLRHSAGKRRKRKQQRKVVTMPLQVTTADIEAVEAARGVMLEAMNTLGDYMNGLDGQLYDIVEETHTSIALSYRRLGAIVDKWRDVAELEELTRKGK